MKTNDLTGKRFDRLVVECIAFKKNNRVYWKCKCDCGNFVNVLAYNLTKKQTRSCGCYNKEKAKERMVFQNLLYFAGIIEMQNRKTPKGNAHNIISTKLFNDVKAKLPFTLSDGQEKVIKEIMEDKVFGASGNNIVIEEFLEGPEVSVNQIPDIRVFIMLHDEWSEVSQVGGRGAG